MGVLAFVLVSLIPIALLLLTGVRNSREASQVIGGIELVGLAVYDAYPILPPFGWPAVVAAALALVAIGAVLVGLMHTDLPDIIAHRRRSADVY
jgi:hypothetical protein